MDIARSKPNGYYGAIEFSSSILSGKTSVIIPLLYILSLSLTGIEPAPSVWKTPILPLNYKLQRYTQQELNL